MEKYYVVLTLKTFYVIINILYYKGGILIFSNRQMFLNWYSGLNLKPFNEVMPTCIQRTECTNCSLREGCPLRPMFYLDDLEFEKNLQIAEIQTRQTVSSMIPLSAEFIEERTFNSTQKLRYKRMKELKEHEDFSLT